jgi:hypothetical protein
LKLRVRRPHQKRASSGRQFRDLSLRHAGDENVTFTVLAPRIPGTLRTGREVGLGGLRAGRRGLLNPAIRCTERPWAHHLDLGSARLGGAFASPERRAVHALSPGRNQCRTAASSVRAFRPARSVCLVVLRRFSLRFSSARLRHIASFALAQSSQRGRRWERRATKNTLHRQRRIARLLGPAKGNIDRSRPDAVNIWAKTAALIGPVYKAKPVSTPLTNRRPSCFETFIAPRPLAYRVNAGETLDASHPMNVTWRTPTATKSAGRLRPPVRAGAR